MGPVAYLSGVVFTWIGTAIEREVAPPTRAAGWMTFWNTIGSGLGPLVAGFVLLPLLGTERSFLVLSGVYGLVALFASLGLGMHIREPRRALVAVGCAAMLVAAFPHGRMERDYVPRDAWRTWSPWLDENGVRARGEFVAAQCANELAPRACTRVAPVPAHRERPYGARPRQGAKLGRADARRPRRPGGLLSRDTGPLGSRRLVARARDRRVPTPAFVATTPDSRVGRPRAARIRRCR